MAVKNTQKQNVAQAVANGKALPNNAEAEHNLLGCMLVDSDVALDIAASLEVEDFYLKSHKIIVGAMKALARNSQPIELVTVKDCLVREGNLESVGGLEYLLRLSESTPSSVNYKVYLKIVKRCSALRRLIRASCDTIEESYISDDDKATLAAAEKRIFDISQGKSNNEITNLADSTYLVMQRFDEAHRRHGAMTGVATGIRRLDNLTRGFQKGTLLILAATTGIGKSSLALNMAEFAARNGKKIAIFSLEMPKEEIAQRFICSMSGVSMSRALAGKLEENDWEKIDIAVNVLNRLDIFVDDSSMTTPDALLSKCRRIKSRKGLDLVIVDYLQLMSMSDKSSSESRQREISEITRNLKIISKELGIPILALSQLSREAAKRNYSDQKEPVLSDLRESGAIEQDADMVMFIHKPYGSTDVRLPVEDVHLIVAKHRNGALDKIPLKWLGEIVKFCNSEEEAELVKQNGSAPYDKQKEQEIPDEDVPMPDDSAAIVSDDEQTPDQTLPPDTQQQSATMTKRQRKSKHEAPSDTLNQSEQSPLSDKQGEGDDDEGEGSLGF